MEITINNIATKFEEWIEWVYRSIYWMCNNMNIVVYTGRCHTSFDWDAYIKMKRKKHQDLGTNKMGRPNKKVCVPARACIPK